VPVEPSKGPRSHDPARLPVETAERIGRLTLVRVLAVIVVLSMIGAVLAGLSFGSLVRGFDRLGPKPTCTQCQLPERGGVVTRGTDTVATIVELAILAPDRRGDDSLRLYRARLHRGQSLGTDIVVVAHARQALPLKLIPHDSVRQRRIVGRLFIEGADQPVAVLTP
jgi:hypothetical protein